MGIISQSVSDDTLTVVGSGGATYTLTRAQLAVKFNANGRQKAATVAAVGAEILAAMGYDPARWDIAIDFDTTDGRLLNIIVQRKP